MKKNIITWVILLSVFLNANDINQNWEKLIHHKNNENQIKSKEFYLSVNSNVLPQEELKITKELLKSKDGFKIACTFPARYKFIKSNFKNIPEFDLNYCTELNEYLNSYPKDKLSIVFTSEYTNNPSSAFGHIMLLFSNDNEPFEVGDVVHFAAKTSNEDNFFKYSYKGMTGAYNGYFIREPFFKKIYEYNTLEQRYMYIYTLDLTKEEIKLILFHLYELRKATFKYFFLDGNCASQTTDLLRVILDIDISKSLYYLPIKTVEDLEKKVIEENRFIPLINKLNLLIQNMSFEEKKEFNRIIETNENINKNTPDIVKEALVIHTTFNFRRFHNVYKNYENVMSQNFEKSNIQDNSLDPLMKTKPSNLGIGYFTNENNHYLNIEYRPLFINLYDIQNNDLQESQIETFTTEFFINYKTIKLNTLDIIDIKSFPLQLDYYKPLSWNVYSGLNRENYNEKLLYNNEFGLGRTFSLTNNSKFSFLINLGLEELDYYIKPNLFIEYFPTNDSKVGLLSYFKQYENENFNKNEIFYSHKYSDYIFSIKYILDNSVNPNKYFLNIKYNF